MLSSDHDAGYADSYCMHLPNFSEIDQFASELLLFDQKWIS